MSDNIDSIDELKNKLKQRKRQIKNLKQQLAEVRYGESSEEVDKLKAELEACRQKILSATSTAPDADERKLAQMGQKDAEISRLRTLLWKHIQQSDPGFGSEGPRSVDLSAGVGGTAETGGAQTEEDRVTAAVQLGDDPSYQELTEGETGTGSASAEDGPSADETVYGLVAVEGTSPINAEFDESTSETADAEAAPEEETPLETSEAMEETAAASTTIVQLVEVQGTLPMYELRPDEAEPIERSPAHISAALEAVGAGVAKAGADGGSPPEEEDETTLSADEALADMPEPHTVPVGLVESRADGGGDTEEEDEDGDWEVPAQLLAVKAAGQQLVAHGSISALTAEENEREAAASDWQSETASRTTATDDNNEHPQETASTGGTAEDVASEDGPRDAPRDASSVSKDAEADIVASNTVEEVEANAEESEVAEVGTDIDTPAPTTMSTATAGTTPSTASKPAFPSIQPLSGLEFAATEAGIRYEGRKDLVLMKLDVGSVVAGVFTRSKTRAAPVNWSAEALENHVSLSEFEPVGILVNSGNANAFTGLAGKQAVEHTASAAAELIGADRRSIFTASTGVIGEALPVGAMIASIDDLRDNFHADGWLDAAEAIMTTDTYPKGATLTTEIDGVDVAISGIAKGSGMVAPDMATMLSFIFTDANIHEDALQELLRETAESSFNAITVDGDTSTSDTVLLASTRKADHVRIDGADDRRLDDFRAGLKKVALNLAHQIVRDGEGASKFITVNVRGAQHDRAAKRIAFAIANSPLVKTAFAGEDPNWGRIVMAIGKSGEAADRDGLRIHFGDILVAENGQVAEGYREETAAAYMKGDDLSVTVDCGVSDGKATVWTCDLTGQYVTINADYRS